MTKKGAGLLLLNNSTISLLYKNIVIFFLSFIDVTWEQEIFEESIRSTETFLSDMGTSQEEIDKAIDQANVAYANQPKGILGAITNTGKGLLWYAILALIIGGVQKDKKKEEEIV